MYATKQLHFFGFNESASPGMNGVDELWNRSMYPPIDHQGMNPSGDESTGMNPPGDESSGDESIGDKSTGLIKG